MRNKTIIFLLLLFIALTVSVCYADNDQIKIITAVQAVWFGGSCVGCIVRILLPLSRKSEQIDKEGWSHKYTTTTILTVILALLITGLAFPGANIPEAFETLFSLFWMAFASGLGANAALIEVSEYLT